MAQRVKGQRVSLRSAKSAVWKTYGERMETVWVAPALSGASNLRFVGLNNSFGCANCPFDNQSHGDAQQHKQHRPFGQIPPAIRRKDTVNLSDLIPATDLGITIWIKRLPPSSVASDDNTHHRYRQRNRCAPTSGGSPAYFFSHDMPKHRTANQPTEKECDRQP